MVAQKDANIVEVNKFCGKTSNIMMIKGKRTKRSRPLSPLALTMSSTTTTTTTTITVEGGGANSAAIEEWTIPPLSDASTISEEEDMAHCLILLAKGSNQKGTISNNISTNNENNSFECKTCNKSFSSFQALGGHRASHKKLKPTLTLPELDKSSTPSSLMFSLINTDHNHHQHHFDDGDTTLSLQLHRPLSNTNNTNHHHHANSKGNKVHECGICGAEFSSGQALGGHMRRHRPIGTSATTTSPHKTIPITPLEDVTIGANNSMIKEEKVNNTRNFLSLDLNLPAPEDEQNLQHLRQSSSKFGFSSNEKTLVFSASSQLLDCHY